MADISERAVAQQGQEKFQFYLLSLVFTLLALSVQTAKLGSSPISDYIEVGGWVCLLASGVAGLWFMETSPTLRVQMTEKRDQENYIFKMRELQLEGQKKVYVLETSSDQAIVDIIKSREGVITALKPLIDKLERHQGVKYTVFRYGFLVGVLLVAAARAFPAFVHGAAGLAT
jgi:hypothetical protein